jgi:hypothetical protein
MYKPTSDAVDKSVTACDLDRIDLKQAKHSEMKDRNEHSISLSPPLSVCAKFERACEHSSHFWEIWGYLIEFEIHSAGAAQMSDQDMTIMSIVGLEGSLVDEFRFC